tara:strand:- start:39 stop:146 length:108 start_codon:yes stop_codon:yes gene_type:complete
MRAEETTAQVVLTDHGPVARHQQKRRQGVPLAKKG